LVGIYGRSVAALRSFTQATLNNEPKWRHKGSTITTGYHPKHYSAKERIP
jgi:hydrogenase small subunit